MKTEVIKKTNSLKILPKIITNLKYKNPLIVTGRNSYEASSAKKIINKISSKTNVTRFSDFSINPRIEDALKGAKIFHKNKCEYIISIGGGSVIDMGKLINAFQAYQNREYKLVEGKIKIKKKLKYNIVIPTTAGTGSEATHFAVCYINKKKYSLASKKLFSQLVIIDPLLMKSMSRYLAASSAFDALSQSIESMWSVNSTKKSINFASISIKIILKNIEKSVNEKNFNSLKMMAEAAYYSGKAINITKTTAPHALSYSIASELDIAHGHSVAIILGYFFEINYYSTNLSSGMRQKKLSKIMNKIFTLMKVKSPEEAKREWFLKMKKCGLESNIFKYESLTKRKINKIISSVNIERLLNHPIILTKKDLNKLFEK
ncbi:phosphonoacetaldehyde reductase [Pelagibacteraceae bacterium]|nr:phosphonoacetaldehyde reductase [Pelagibacteraceae bacterium]